MGACLLALLAGALSLLSPCVLPLLPVVLSGALDRHRLGPLALAGGLAISATAFGLALAALGLALDRDLVRAGAATLLIVFGAILLSTHLDRAWSTAFSPVARQASVLLSRLGGGGLGGQLVTGVLLGILWIPCGGPTLGSSISLAARRESLPAAAAVMLAYSIGAALPLVVFAYGSRRALMQPARLAAMALAGKALVGATLLAVGSLTLLGADKALEAALVDRMPPWLLDLTTRF